LFSRFIHLFLIKGHIAVRIKTNNRKQLI